ncbi:MAG: hypothetical protein N3A66_06895, partial [Planctomycetota bacterium]|nr:hypothetical protein [Planctomycetota bacterium]
MPDTGLADLENLLAAAAPASASAEVQAKGRKFGQLLFTTAAEAWGSFLGKRLFCEQGETSCQRPADALAEMPPQVIVTRFQISGKAGSDHYLVLPALLAKDLVAHFLALASGEEAKPETQRLDDEAMEAYRELVNILAGQATVA